MLAMTQAKAYTSYKLRLGLGTAGGNFYLDQGAAAAGRFFGKMRSRYVIQEIMA